MRAGLRERASARRRRSALLGIEPDSAERLDGAHPPVREPATPAHRSRRLHKQPCLDSVLYCDVDKLTHRTTERQHGHYIYCRISRTHICLAEAAVDAPERAPRSPYLSRTRMCG